MHQFQLLLIISSIVLNMILFKNLDSQKNYKKGTMQQQIQRQNTDINGKQKNFYKIYILLCSI